MIFQKNILFVLLIASTQLVSCGRLPSEKLAESLPNQMVPLDTTAEDASEPKKPDATSQYESTSPLEIEQEFKLTPTALMLGVLSSADYNARQKKWVGSTYPACNFFLITSLCEAGYCKKSKPFYKAGDFDIYLLSAGFKKLNLDVVKSLYASDKKFDLVFQKKNPIAGRSGHVMVGLGYDFAKKKMLIAQGNSGKTTHEIKLVSDEFILEWQGGFNVFVRQ